MSSLQSQDTSWLQFQLICKPEQSGKTFIMIKQLIQDITDPIEGKTIVNFICCDQSLLLVKQTGERVKSELIEYTDGTNTYVELSSSKYSDCHTNSEVLKEILIHNIKNIICCTNSKRMSDIYELIDNINKSSHITQNFHFNIWLDEADKFIKFIDSILIPVVERHSNVNVKLITATPQPLFKKYKYMNVFPIEQTTSEIYHGWRDNQIKIINEHSEHYLGYIEHILDLHPEIIVPGSNGFIPALHEKKTHHNIVQLCIQKKIAVICVNGDGIKVTIPNLDSDYVYYKMYEKTEELKITIRQIMMDHQLDKYPVVITGYLCIGRGVSIIDEQFGIDYAILSHYSTKTEASQLAGRVKGNIKHFKNYKIPIVFTTDKFNQIACEFEEKSRNLAKLAFVKEQQGILTIINKNEFNTCNKPFEYIIHPELFNTYKECKQFLDRIDIKTKMGITKSVSLKDTKTPIHMIDGYAVTSKLLKSGQTISDLTKEMRITIQIAESIPAGLCISSNKGSCYLILPVYDSMDTPPEIKEKYQVRYISYQ
jgi:hypothetical protein